MCAFRVPKIYFQEVLILFHLISFRWEKAETQRLRGVVWRPLRSALEPGRGTFWLWLWRLLEPGLNSFNSTRFSLIHCWFFFKDSLKPNPNFAFIFFILICSLELIISFIWNLDPVPQLITAKKFIKIYAIQCKI